MLNSALEILLQKDVQSIFDTFSACFNVRILFYAPDGREVLSGHARATDCRYCELLQKKLFGEERCLEMDARKREESLQANQLLSYQCHAGLMEAVMPIRAGQNLCGYAMLGQMRCANSMPPEIAAAWEKSHAPQTLRASFEELPLMSEVQMRHMLDLFAITVRYIVSQNLITLRGDLMLEDALRHMREHLGQPLALADVAARVHRSVSTLSHLFRKKMKKNFRQTLIDLRMDRAEEILRTTPGITIAEVATRVGYPDPFHFSTLYRKHRGCPPSVFVRRIRQEKAGIASVGAETCCP